MTAGAYLGGREGVVTAPVTIATSVSAAVMAALGGIHLCWAAGSSWPARDREALADSASGRRGSDPPPASACLAVAGLLLAASGLTMGRPRRLPRTRRLGAAAVSSTFLVRGAFGVLGRTHLIFPGARSERFRELDRRYYGPLCLGIAALSAPSWASLHSFAASGRREIPDPDQPKETK